MRSPLLEIRDLAKHYKAKGVTPLGRDARSVRAVDGVDLTIAEGETLGLVGESGCGKSTLARTILFLEKPTTGEIYFQGERLTSERIFDLRRRAQIVFQDPYSSLPPRMKVGSIIGDPLEIHGIARGSTLKERIAELLVDVGLKPGDATKYPHQMSGGQRQRVGIARALAVQPSLIVADEAVSSLDVSVQAQILNLLKALQERHRLSYLFVSHDLGVVKYVSHRIAVMYLGEIVEQGDAEELYQRPAHPYTRALLSAVPTLQNRDSQRVKLKGEPPNPADPPPGCKFHPRCPMAQDICTHEAPRLEERIPRRQVACHFAGVDVPVPTSADPSWD